MKYEYNPNLVQLISAYENGKSGIILEGGSRSGKTWSSVDFIIYICSKFANKGIIINIIRETYNSFKTTLYDDFNRRFPDFSLQSPCSDARDVQSFKLFGNKINFLGADKPSKFHGAGCDFFFCNEVLDIPKEVFDQQEQRCRLFWFIDYNPKYTEHWVFNSLANRDDVAFFHSTLLTNPFISEGEKNKILSYEPTAENIRQGTADDFNWKVYGLGLRSAIKGVIFKNVNWIDEFPKDLDYQWGLDYGFTNDPTALVKIGIKDKDIFAELLCYEPIDSAIVLSDFLEKVGVKQHELITADSSDKYNDVEMCRDLKNLYWNIQKVNKSKGIVWSIGKVKEYSINIVNNVNAKREQENYRWREINGISLNQPVDKFNHFWDALRYGFLGLEKKQSTIIWK